MNNRDFGHIGEELAAAFLEKNSHTILERSYRTKLGEIDIISRRENGIHFTEVKTRGSGSFGAPSEAITPTKLRHIRNTAELYIDKNPKAGNIEYFIDVIEISVNYIQGV